MKTIYKYVVTDVDNKIYGPIERILCVHEQHGNICIWAEVDTDLKDVEYSICIVGTGYSRDWFFGHEYIGTVMMEGGDFVFHVYAKRLGGKLNESTESVLRQR